MANVAHAPAHTADRAASQEQDGMNIRREWTFGAFHVIFLRSANDGYTANDNDRIIHAIDTLVDTLTTATEGGVASKSYTALVNNFASTTAKAFRLDLTVVAERPNDEASPLTITFARKALILT